MTARTQLIYDALKKGPITSYGPIYDVDHKRLSGVRAIDIKTAQDELVASNVRISRLDSGGTPSWGIV